MHVIIKTLPISFWLEKNCVWIICHKTSSWPLCASRQKASMEYQNELNLFPKLNILESLCQIIIVNICTILRNHPWIINTREETCGDQQQATIWTMDFVPFVLFCKNTRTALQFPSFAIPIYYPYQGDVKQSKLATDQFLLVKIVASRSEE